MPVTGGLNNVKSSLRVDSKGNIKLEGIGLDRFDTSVYFLDENFNRINEFKDCKDNFIKRSRNLFFK
jgi:pyruvate/oxaloacetate carboxyltransferase